MRQTVTSRAYYISCGAKFPLSTNILKMTTKADKGNEAEAQNQEPRPGSAGAYGLEIKAGPMLEGRHERKPVVTVVEVTMCGQNGEEGAAPAEPHSCNWMEGFGGLRIPLEPDGNQVLRVEENMESYSLFSSGRKRKPDLTLRRYHKHQGRFDGHTPT